MIAKLYGIVDTLYEDRLIINVQGVGYEVLCPLPVLQQCLLSHSVVLWTEHLFREDGQSLYGFLRYEDQLWFREMIKVHGIGAKAALALLSSVPVSEIASAILHQDESILTKVSGIGSKMAQRILAELKNSKLVLQTPVEIENSTINYKIQEVIDALVSLGYDRYRAKQTVTQIKDAEIFSTENLLKMALGKMI